MKTIEKIKSKRNCHKKDQCRAQKRILLLDQFFIGLLSS